MVYASKRWVDDPIPIGRNRHAAHGSFFLGIFFPGIAPAAPGSLLLRREHDAGSAFRSSAGTVQGRPPGYVRDFKASTLAAAADEGAVDRVESQFHVGLVDEDAELRGGRGHLDQVDVLHRHLVQDPVQQARGL